MYSGLTAAHMHQILKENNIKSKGKIFVPSMDVLLKNLAIPASFFDQLEIFLQNNVRTVRAFPRCGLTGRLKVGAER